MLKFVFVVLLLVNIGTLTVRAASDDPTKKDIVCFFAEMTGLDDLLKYVTIPVSVCKLADGYFEVTRVNQDPIPFEDQIMFHGIEVKDGLLLTKELVNLPKNKLTAPFKLIAMMFDGYANIFQSLDEKYNIQANLPVTRERLEGVVPIDGREYHIGLDLLKYEGQITKYIVLEDIKISPKLHIDAARIELDLRLVVGGLAPFPTQRVIYNQVSGIINSNRRISVRINNSLQDMYFGEDVKAGHSYMIVSVLERNWPWLSAKPIAHGLLDNINKPLPLPAANLTAVSEYSSVRLELSDIDTPDEILVYRYAKSFSGNTTPEVLVNLNCSGLECIDDTVELGNFYYYRVRYKIGNRISHHSEIAVGSPTTEYAFANLSYDGQVTAGSNRYFRGNVLNFYDNEPISADKSVRVQLSIPEFGVVYQYVVPDEQGFFEIYFPSPNAIGEYTYRLDAFIDGNVISAVRPFEIILPDDTGRDLKINSVSFNRTVLKGGPLTGTVSFENAGSKDEPAGRINLRLFTLDGTPLDSLQLTFTLNSRNSATLPFSLAQVASYNQGDYLLRVELTNAAQLDNFLYDNFESHIFSVYDQLPSTSAYRVSSHILTHVGESITIAGGSLVWLSYANGQVRFTYRGEQTSNLSIGSTGQNFYAGTEQQFFIRPLSVTSDSLLTFEFGVPESASTVSPAVAAISRGQGNNIEIQLPQGRVINPSSIQFIGSTGSVIESWRNTDSDKSDSPNHFSLALDIPPSRAIGRNTAWISFSDDNYKYYRQIHVDVKPAIRGQFVPGTMTVAMEGELLDANNNQLSLVAGQFPVISGKFINDGDTELDQFIFVNISGPNGYRHGAYTRFKILAGDEVSFSIDWNTIGLDNGFYIGLVIPYNNNLTSAQLSNSRVELTMQLTDPPPLQLDYLSPTKIYSTGESIQIMAFVGYLDQPLHDASVTAEVLQPDGSLKKLQLHYDSHLKEFTGDVPVVLGGNYYVKVRAERRYYLPAEFETIEKAYASMAVRIRENETNLRIHDAGVLDIQIEQTGGVHAFGADFAFSNPDFSLIDFRESSLFNGRSTVPVSIQANFSASSAITGVTRLGDQHQPLVVHNPGLLAHMAFRPTAVGETELTLSNVVLMDRFGEPIPVKGLSTVSLSAYQTEALIQVSAGNSLLYQYGRDTLSVSLNNAYLAQGAELELQYNPAEIQVLDILEGLAFRSSDEEQSLFLVRHDQQSGRINISVSRTGDGGRLDISTGGIARIPYRILSDNGTTPEISVTDARVLTPYSGVSLPVLTFPAQLNIRETPAPEKVQFAVSAENVNREACNMLVLAVTGQHLHNVAGFNSVIGYSDPLLKLVSVKAGDALLNAPDGQVTVQYHVDSTEQHVTVGVASLGQPDSTFYASGDTLLYLVFDATAIDSINFSISNAGYTDRSGNVVMVSDIEGISVSGLFCREELENPALQFSVSRVYSDDSDLLTIEISLDKGSNLYAFAGNITYDSALLHLTHVEDAGGLSENGSITTQLLYSDDTETGTISIGLSRLQVDTGLYSEEAVSLFRMHFRQKAGDTLRVNFEGIRLLLPNGIDYISLPDELLEIVPSQHITRLYFSPSIVFSDSEGQVSLDIMAENISNVYAFASDISYDTSVMQFVRITEGNFLSESGTAQTSFNFFNEPQTGRLTVGISRIGDAGGLSESNPVRLATLVLRQQEEDSSRVLFQNPGLLMPDGVTRVRPEHETTLIGRVGDSFPELPSMLTPVNGDTLFADYSFLSWQDTGIKQLLRVQVSEGSDFSLIVADSLVEGDKLGLGFVDLVSDSSYYWRIKATNPYGSTDWSDYWAFVSSNQTSGVFETIELSMLSGWNLVGIPSEIEHESYLDVFTNALDNSLFSFDGSYRSAQAMVPGKGYWVRYLSPAIEVMQVQPNTHIQFALNIGWNLVSGPDTDYVANLIDDPEAVIVPGTLFGFSGTYQPASVLAPGRGYWIRASAAGLVAMGQSSTMARGIAVQSFIDLGSFDRIEIVRGGSATGEDLNHSQEVVLSRLYFGGELPEDLHELAYTMPPPAPGQSLDARFADDRWVSGSLVAEVVLSGTTDVLWMRVMPAGYEGESGDGVDAAAASTTSSSNKGVYLLTAWSGEIVTDTQQVTGGALVQLSPGTDRVTVERLDGSELSPEVPAEFALEQNFPNPFNPSTTIRYALPEAAQVRLEVYTLTGQRVAVLASGEQRAGWHTASFDGSALASGVYIYRLQAGGFVQTRKLMLIK
jgi:hypothetical protein